MWTRRRLANVCCRTAPNPAAVLPDSPWPGARAPFPRPPALCTTMLLQCFTCPLVSCLGSHKLTAPAPPRIGSRGQSSAYDEDDGRRGGHAHMGGGMGPAQCAQQ